MANRSTAMRGLLGAFMSRRAFDAPTGVPASTCTRTILDYGVPLEDGLSSRRIARFMRDARDALFDHFDVGESAFGWSRWRGACETAQLRVRMFMHDWHTREGTTILANDVLYVAFSTGFVYVYLALHFRSVALATLGMLQILMSLPLARLVYPFRFIREHLIAIFLSLGVGAISRPI